MLVLIAGIQFNAIAQSCDYEPSSKAAKLLEKTKDKKKYDSSERFEMMEEALDIDEECLPCLHYLGSASFKRAKRGGSFGPAEQYLKQLVALCPDYHSEPFYFLGAISYATQEYDAAQEYFDKFIHFPADDESKFKKNYDKKYEEVKEVLPHIQFWKEFYESDLVLDPKRVEGVSSMGDDYLPTISADGEIMFYTRKTKKKSLGDSYARDVELFYWSKRPDINADFDGGEPLPKPFNVGTSYGGSTISLNNKEMFIAAKNPVPSNQENVDIFVTLYALVYDDVAKKKIYKWSELTLLGSNINTDSGWEAQPSLSGDGQMLFFTAVNGTTMPDSQGNQSHDIMVSNRTPSGEWGPAKSISSVINTKGQEKSPFMHSDSRTLYFASDGHYGRGKMDIFFSKLKDDGSWTEPKNIGHPINTKEDETGLIVSADGEEAFFFSRKEKEAKGYDIFSFTMPEKARPEKVMILKGEIKDENNEAIKGATIELTYAESKDTQSIKVDEDDGKYAAIVRLENNESVVMTVKKEGIAFNSRVVAKKDPTIVSKSKEDIARVETLEGASAKGTGEIKNDITVKREIIKSTLKRKKRPAVVKLEIFTEEVKPNKPFVINDIFYKTNSSEIDEESKLILQAFAGYLDDNPTMRIEIRGHTDDQGTDSDNLALSMDRAFEVKGLLERNGVDGKRVTAKGYGESKPVSSNTSAEGRAKNRRTEFVVK